MRRSFIAIGCLLVAVAPGCAACSNPAADDGGTGGAGGGTSAGDLPLSQLGPAFVQDLCTYLMQCQGAPYCSPQDCAQLFPPFGLSTLEAEVAAGWTLYDPLAAAACHQTFQSNPCGFGFFFFLPDVQEVLARCPGVLTGTRAAGQTCASGADCVPSSQCLAPSNACPGTCTPWLGADAGCSLSTGPACDPRQNLNCTNGVCRPPAKVGEQCPNTSFCFNNGAQLWCDLDAGVCAPMATLGQPCEWSVGGARAPGCAKGLWCDRWSGVGACRAPSDVGGPCLTLDFDDCLEPSVCVSFPDAGTGFGRCAMPAGDGGRCDSSVGCATDLWCSGGFCVPLPGLGLPCGGAFRDRCASGLLCGQADGGSVCMSSRCLGETCGNGQTACAAGRCVGGQCTAPVPLGGPCGVNGDCASGQCTASQCVDPFACLP